MENNEFVALDPRKHLAYLCNEVWRNQDDLLDPLVVPPIKLMARAEVIIERYDRNTTPHRDKIASLLGTLEALYE